MTARAPTSSAIAGVSRTTLAAEPAEAAATQGRFWEMHDRLFRHRDAVTPDDIVAHAEAIGLDVPLFDAELEAGVHSRRVREDVTSAEGSGVSGTPTFFVNGERHDGPYDKAALVAHLVATASPLPGPAADAG